MIKIVEESRALVTDEHLRISPEEKWSGAWRVKELELS
jgi:hypothetical protein